jgi:hypothetical protein
LSAWSAAKQTLDFETAHGKLDATTQRGDHASPPTAYGSLPLATDPSTYTSTFICRDW